MDGADTSSPSRAERRFGLGELGRDALGVGALLLCLLDEQLRRALSLLGRLLRDPAPRCSASAPRRAGPRRARVRPARPRRSAPPGRPDRLERAETDRLQLLGQPAALQERAARVVDGRGAQRLAEAVEQRRASHRSPSCARALSEQRPHRVPLCGGRLVDLLGARRRRRARAAGRRAAARLRLEQRRRPASAPRVRGGWPRHATTLGFFSARTTPRPRSGAPASAERRDRSAPS